MNGEWSNDESKLEKGQSRGLKTGNAGSRRGASEKKSCGDGKRRQRRCQTQRAAMANAGSGDGKRRVQGFQPSRAYIIYNVSASALSDAKDYVWRDCKSLYAERADFKSARTFSHVRMADVPRHVPTFRINHALTSHSQRSDFAFLPFSLHFFILSFFIFNILSYLCRRLTFGTTFVELNRTRQGKI